MVATDIGKKLVSPALSDNQISITEIPRKLYAHFYPNRIGNGGMGSATIYAKIITCQELRE